MTGFTDRVSRQIIDHITGKTTIFAKVTPMYLALFTAVGLDDGTGFTEVSGNGYARVATAITDWNAAAGTGPSSAANANAATFPASSGAWNASAPIIAFGLYDASIAGNLLAWDYLGSGAWKPFSATLASPSAITAPAHGFAAADQIVMSAEGGGTLPTGIFTGLLTVAAAPTTDTFNVSVNASASGSGLLRKVVPLVVGSAGITPAFAAGTLTLVSG